jgi:hypothetical protein
VIKMARTCALYCALGLALSLTIAALASAAPSVFGYLTVPFWILPGVLNYGAHDSQILPLMVISGTLVYGILLFGAFRIARCWRHQRSEPRQ